LGQALFGYNQCCHGLSDLEEESGIAIQSRRPAATGTQAARGWDVIGALPWQRTDLDDGLTVPLSGGAEAAVRARGAISSLRADLDPTLLDTLRLLVTELVVNSVRHARADAITLRLVVGRSAVLAEVTDGGPGFDPAVAGSPRDDHTGWGLFLVERLAERWGVSRTGRATRVWFELHRGRPV
jgi:anti-sigma regulatory factor (Ser/Thr protein kinase)